MLQRFRHWLSRSLSHRLTFFSVATATVLVLLLGGLVMPVIALRAVRNFDDRQTNELERISDHIELRLESARQSLGRLARNSFVINAYVDSTGREIYLQPTLRDFVLPFDMASRVALFDAGGKLFASSTPLREAELPAIQTIAREAFAAEAVRIVVDRDSAARQILFSIPIYYPPASHYEGVLVGIVPLDGPLASAVKTTADNECLTVESKGMVLTRFGCAETSGGESVVHDLLPAFPGTLVMKLARNRTALYTDLAMFLLAYLLLSGAAIAMTFAVSRRASRHFTDQLLSLGAASRQLVENPQSQIVLNWPNPDEIGQFADSFSRMVAALQELHADLERRVLARTEELAAAVDRAEAANLAKSQFLTTMSHEIRTPLNGVLGMAQLLTMSDLTEQERGEYARTIITAGQTLLTILNDILDFSKVEAGRLELTLAPFQPLALLKQADALFGQAARSKHLSFTAEWHGPVGATYRGDAGRIRQMLTNLVGNAIKFTHRGGVHVSARERECDAEGVLLEFVVADTGIGIPADKRDRLFKPFSQVDSSGTRQYGGTGLGLSIVRSFAQLMRGDVGVKSGHDNGSVFWFTVRCEPADDEAVSTRAIAGDPDSQVIDGVRKMPTSRVPSS